MSGVMSVGGLVSGLDIDGILAKLQTVAQAPVTRMQSEKKTLNAKYTAWNEVNTGLLTLQQRASDLSNLASQISRQATSSDSSVSVTTSSNATPGAFAFTVTSLSTFQQQIATQSYPDQNISSVGTGVLKITQGESTTEIDVDNLTLEELRDKINAGNSGAKAMVVSENGSSYRLILTATTEGTAGQFTVDAGGLSGGIGLTTTELQEAKDTVLTFGSGASEMTVTRIGTTLTDVIPGLTLNLKNESVGKTVTVNVKESTSGVKNAITAFVNQYNAFLDWYAQQNAYNQDTGSSGTLFGESRLQQIAADLSSTLMTTVRGADAEIDNLVDLGIKTDSKGKLTIDNTVLDAKIKDHLQGVIKLFAQSGTSTDTRIAFMTATEDTKESGSAGYNIHVTQHAAQASMTLNGTGGAGLPAILGQDEDLSLNTTLLHLTAGMTPEQIVAAINGESATHGVIASLTDPNENGEKHLTLTYKDYGAGHLVQVVSTVDPNAHADSTGIGTSVLVNTAPTASFTGVTGQDVAGFLNWNPDTQTGEAATGDGRILTGTTGATNGLQVEVTASAGTEFGPLTYTRGLGSYLTEMLSFVTDPEEGSITSMQEGLQARMDLLDKNIATTSAGVTREIERMRNQFNAMEVALSRLQSQSSQLSGLISQLATYTSS